DEIPHGPWAKFGENNTFVQNARKTQERVAQNSTTETVAASATAGRPAGT
ncbi:MAG: hypothetical protein QOD99_819, partial [Chthoniobacter sp.]|nr:hypothetical protein [Chthoniobacter sp.]